MFFQVISFCLKQSPEPTRVVILPFETIGATVTLLPINTFSGELLISCHCPVKVNAVPVLFVAGSDNARSARILRAALASSAATSSALLPVTECELGLQYGSVINLRIIEDRVRFDVSLDSAERNNVKLSSRLLTVANRVVKGNS